MQYVSYLRVSTKKQQKSGLGLEAQKAVIEHFCNDSEIVKEFIESESGKNIDNRPVLQSAIKYCIKHNCILVVAKLDRLSRDVEHIFKIKKQLGDLFKSCDLPNTDSLTLSIFAGLAQREREIISIRTKLALKAKKARGMKLGKPENLTAAGRQKAHKAVRAKADTNTNNIRVMELCSMYRKNGLTLQQVADKLNTQGHKTPSGKGTFQKTTISRLLKRYERLKTA